MTDTAPAIEVIDVCKSYQRPVLRQVSLRLAPGTAVGFIGPNGAGKTTLLRILVGLTFRDSGQVRVAGLDPAVAPLELRRSCCYLPGEINVYTQMTGQEFLDFGLSFYPRLQHDLMQQMLEAYALPLDQRVRRYSAGMKQKLALIATLVPDVAIYLLDEPDRALDATARLQLRQWLGHLKRSGKTVFLSTHHLSEIEAVAEQLVFLLDGQIVSDVMLRQARQRLQSELRIRVVEGTVLPSGAEVLREADGSWRVSCIEPLQWLQQIPNSNLLAAEIGMTRLDRLYQILIEGGA